jgi:hypothetical protein
MARKKMKDKDILTFLMFATAYVAFEVLKNVIIDRSVKSYERKKGSMNGHEYINYEEIK